MFKVGVKKDDRKDIWIIERKSVFDLLFEGQLNDFCVYNCTLILTGMKDCSNGPVCVDQEMKMLKISYEGYFDFDRKSWVIIKRRGESLFEQYSKGVY